MRVNIRGQQFEVSSNRYVEPSKWSSEAGKIKGISEETRNINHRLDITKQRVYDYQRIVMREGQVTLQTTH